VTPERWHEGKIGQDSPESTPLGLSGRIPEGRHLTPRDLGCLEADQLPIAPVRGQILRSLPIEQVD
jgi:hypothetical protein